MDTNICLHCERPLSPTSSNSNDATTKCFCSETCRRCEATKTVRSSPGTPDNSLRFSRIAGGRQTTLPGGATPLLRRGLLHGSNNRGRSAANSNTPNSRTNHHDPQQKRKRSASTPLYSAFLVQYNFKPLSPLLPPGASSSAGLHINPLVKAAVQEMTKKDEK